jgi:hypothetical protein
VPDDRIEIVESDPSADHADVGMKREHQMPAVRSTRDAYVTHNADQTSPGNQNSEDLPPYLFQLGQEDLIVLDVSELAGTLVIAFEIPVRRGRDHEMDRVVMQKRQFPGITIN